MSVDSIHVTAPAGYEGVVSTAMGLWNDSSCNSGGDAFPSFSSNQAGTSRTINVRVINGLNPNNNQSCGNFQGVTVTVYTQVYNPNRGQQESCGSGSTFAQTIAHELGHALGLSDQMTGCRGYMMSQRQYNNNGLLIPRSPQAEECGLLDRVHLTQKEAAEDDPCPFLRLQLAPISPDYVQGDPECPEDPPPNSSPIVIDLDRGGFDFTGLDDPVRFDIDADGVAETLSWTDPKSRDALLALDHNGNGVIDDGGELFGDSSRLLSGGTAAHGFHALAELDSPAFGGNADGFLDDADLEFHRLVLWHDTDHDGISDPGELTPLPDSEVLRIGLTYVENRRRDRHGNELRYNGKAWLVGADGRVRPTHTTDVFFVLNDGPTVRRTTR